MSQRITILAILTLAFGGLTVEQASGAVIYVDANVVGGAENGTSWADAFPDLQLALEYASPGVEIWVADGTYIPSVRLDNDIPGSETFQLLDDVGLYGGFEGQDSVVYPGGETERSQRDPARNSSILYGAGVYHVVYSGYNSSTTILDGFVITGGRACKYEPPYPPPEYYEGAGLYMTDYQDPQDGSPTIANCTFVDNFSIWGGGGMMTHWATEQVINCAFYANTTTYYFGGGACDMDSGGARYSGCIFAGNTSELSGTGGLHCEGHGTVSNCVFTGNVGDGMSTTWVSAVNCTFYGNSGDGASAEYARNCVAWGNGSPYQLAVSSATHCCVQGGYTGPGFGNIDLDPQFVDPDGLDDVLGTPDDNLRLQCGSPCIDAGSNEEYFTEFPGHILENHDLDGQPRFFDDPNTPSCPQTSGDCGTPPIIDMGAYEARPVIFVDANAPVDGAGDGTSWRDAYRDLQDGIAAAASWPCEPGEVWVADGTYKPDAGTGDRGAFFDLLAHVYLFGGFEGWDSATYPGGETWRPQRNLAAGGTILSGDIGVTGDDADNSWNVLRCTAIPYPDFAVLDGFTVTAGNANGTGGCGVDTGGGLYVTYARPVVSNCIFAGNQGTYGGGIGVEYNSYPLLSNCAFTGNAAYRGGGLNLEYAGAKIYDCTFSANTATTDGGGVRVYDGWGITANSVLWGNSDAGGTDESAQIHGYWNLDIDYCCIEGLDQITGDGNIGSDPLFRDPDGPDDTVGTPDDNLRLRIGSPCIDAGDNASVPSDERDLDGDDDTVEPTPIDLDGHPRFVDDPTAPGGSAENPVVDMGAYERQPVIRKGGGPL